jgi:hypothetical protein
MDQQRRLPRLSNDGQLMVFSLVKEGMTIDDALEEAMRMERAELESVQLMRSGTTSQRRYVRSVVDHHTAQLNRPHFDPKEPVVDILLDMPYISLAHVRTSCLTLMICCGQMAHLSQFTNCVL